jgi:hypothetical protein
VRRMRLALVAAVLLAAGAGAASAGVDASACTKAAANAAIRASTLPTDVKDLTRQRLAGVDKLICHDLTRDGRRDMAVTLASGGTAGDIAWAAFARAGTHWRLVAANANGYKLGLFLAGRDLVESQPVYRKQDPNCCPTGGFDHRRFHWNGHALAVVRRWHDRLLRS